MKLAIYIVFLFPGVASSQMLTEGSLIRVKPGDREEVSLYAAVDCAHCYYYLPYSLRVSTKGNAVPEASLVTWKDEDRLDTVGGIFHFLVEWGLTASVEKMVRDLVRSQHDSLAVVTGPVLVSPYDSGTVIDGDDKLSGVLKACMKNDPVVPATPGAKTAFSFRFAENEIRVFLYYLRHPERTNASLKFMYTYKVRKKSGLEQVRKITLKLPFKQILTMVKEK